MAGGVALIFAAFTVYRLFDLDAPAAWLVIALDQTVILVSGLSFLLMQRRRVPVGWANGVTVALGLLVAANTSASVLVQGEGSDLRYLQAIVVGGGAIVLSSRALLVLLLGTAALAVPAAARVGSTDELVDFCVMQLTTSLFGAALCYGRIRSEQRLLALRRQTRQTAEELGQALARAEHEFAEHQRSEKRRQQLEEQLRQAQKLEALGTLAGGVAHDMNNVLGAISAIASEAVQSLGPGAPSRQELGDILTAARRGSTLTQNILSFARRVPPRVAPFRVDMVLREVEVLLRRTLAKRIAVNVAPSGEDQWIEGDAGQINHLVMNLCLNSADAIEGFGHVLISTRTARLDEALAGAYGVPPGEYVEITVTDDGQGIPADCLPRVFEPYFSTKSQQGRSGLGLSMVYGTVQEHRGGITVRSVVGRGTTVSVVFPVHARPESEAPPSRRIPAVDVTRNLLLIVDDEPLLRRAGQRIGEGLGFEVFTASDGQEALRLYAAHRARVGAVVLDVAMPVMSGADCFDALRQQDPELPIVLTSGFAKDHDIQTRLGRGPTRYLRKPFERGELAEMLTQAMSDAGVDAPVADPVRAG